MSVASPAQPRAGRQSRRQTERLDDASRRCFLCGAENRTLMAAFDRKPQGETDFAFESYHRELWRCDGCGHFENSHVFDLRRLYEGAYSAATYGARLRTNFETIMALPPERSDNRQRALYIDAFWETLPGSRERDVVDVGSGLGVFPAAMVERGWKCLAIDPDPQAAAQARDLGRADALSGDFFELAAPRKFTLLTLNKVLEHVPDMVGMLQRARLWLLDRGFVYLELPDGEAAIDDPIGARREEFFVEHFCAFSAASFALLAQRAGFRVRRLDRVREPSGKYTLRGFLE